MCNSARSLTGFSSTLRVCVEDIKPRFIIVTYVDNNAQTRLWTALWFTHFQLWPCKLSGLRRDVVYVSFCIKLKCVFHLGMGLFMDTATVQDPPPTPPTPQLPCCSTVKRAKSLIQGLDPCQSSLLYPPVTAFQIEGSVTTNQCLSPPAWWKWGTDICFKNNCYWNILFLSIFSPWFRWNRLAQSVIAAHSWVHLEVLKAIHKTKDGLIFLTHREACNP